MTNKLARTFVSALALAALTTPLQANDSEAAVGLGGIELVANSAISMDSEDLYISKDEVRVRYRYTNRSARDLELTVSFPVPAIRADQEAFYGDRAIPDFTGLKFVTTVDGKPVSLTAVERAEIGGRDVTARVRALGWPLRWITGTGEQPDFVTALKPAQREAYRREGLLRPISEQDAALMPAWDLVTHVTRKQVFLAGKTVEVTHRYSPMIGGSVAGALAPDSRNQDWGLEHAAHYCIDKTFYAALDRRASAKRKANEEFMAYSETWIDYILSSGRNWKGPIGQFRLVVDKGKPGSLVSFCMNGVKKISPTQFEVRKTNFEPSGDLHILIAEWGQTE
jgi:hypothetical protein